MGRPQEAERGGKKKDSCRAGRLERDGRKPKGTEEENGHVINLVLFEQLECDIESIVIVHLIEFSVILVIQPLGLDKRSSSITSSASLIRRSDLHS
jgi:hypothetical protein